MEIVVPVVLGMLVIVAIAAPIIGRGRRMDTADDPIELEVQRYRAALRAGTVCDVCLEANTEGSRFCSRCGRALPGDDAGDPDDGPAQRDRDAGGVGAEAAPADGHGRRTADGPPESGAS